MLPGLFHGSLSHLSYKTQGLQPSNGTTHSGLHPVLIKRMPLQTCLYADLMEAIHWVRFPLPRDALPSCSSITGPVLQTHSSLDWLFLLFCLGPNVKCSASLELAKV